MRAIFLLLILTGYLGEGGMVANPIRAICKMMAGSGSANISGTIKLSQKSEKSTYLTIDVTLAGFNSTDNITLHGFHAHENGNLSDQCAAAGGHYNPDNVTHGGPKDPPNKRHVGDFGNLKEKSNGAIKTSITVRYVSLVGERSIVNRSLVVHETFDDLGLGNATTSNTTGNSGKRLGCCVITLVNDLIPKSGIKRIPAKKPKKYLLP